MPFVAAALILGLYSYTADITLTTGGQRTLSMAFVEASTGLGQAVLNAVAGLFIQDAGEHMGGVDVWMEEVMMG